MLKNNVGSLVLVFGVASCVCACGSGNTTEATTGGATSAGGVSARGGNASGGTLATGGTSAAGGASAAGGSVTTGGAMSSGGASAAGGSATTGGAMSSGGTAAGGATGTSGMTLADACAHNCTFAVNALDQSGLPTCSSTQDVCVQNCMTTFDNTSALNPDLGKQYTTMMVCVATDPAFSSSAAFVCAKPNSPLNLWSPGGPQTVPPVPNSTCEDDICGWNCEGAEHGVTDPFVDIRCTCSSIH
jgi:hypothetical protein